MCGRYPGIPVSQFKTWGLQPPEGYRQSFNATPQSYQAVILQEQQYQAALMRWGLVPHWSQGSQMKFATFNARSETITSSPAFRDSFYKRRCLVPAMGFYEWKRNDDGSKTPYFFHLKSRPVFGFAGIWDSWKDAEGHELKTFSIITCAPNQLMLSIHNRMPVIIPKELEDAWVTLATPINALEKILKPYDPSNMSLYRVSNYVNDPKIDNERLLTPQTELTDNRNA